MCEHCFPLPLTPGGGPFYLLRFVSINNCRHVRMTQAGYLALFSGWITRGIVLPFSGGALFGYDEYSHIVSDLSTQYVNNVVFGFLMDKKSPR